MLSRRSLHRADPFGLFSEPREGEEEEEGEGEDVAEGKSSGGGEKAGAVVLPDDVTHMLEAMKINRLDKVHHVCISVVWSWLSIVLTV